MSNIKIQDVYQRVQYSATASQTEFSVPFPFFLSTDLVVYSGSTLLVLTTDYTVTGAGSPSGGKVTLVVAATAGDIITIQGLMPIDRTSIYSASISNLTGSDLNGDFNREVVMTKQLETTQELLQLQYKPYLEVSQDDTVTKDRWLPILEANQIWAKDPTDTEIIAYTVPAGGGIAPSVASYILQSANVDLPNAQALDLLASGIMFVTTGTGVITSLTGSSGITAVINDDTQLTAAATNVSTALAMKTYVDNSSGASKVDSLTGIANQVEVDNTDPINPIVLLPAIINAPGTFTIQSTTAINAIIDDDTMIAATATNVSTSEAIVTYIANEFSNAAGGTTGQMQYNNGGAFAGDLITTDGAGNWAGTLALTGQWTVDNLRLDGNTLSSIDTNGNVNLTPNGTGDLVLDGVNWPQADGVSGEVLTTDGAGQTIWQTFPPGSGTVTSSLTNQIAYYPADDDTVEGLPTANSATFVTDSTGAPSWTASMTDGQLLIGVTGGTPVPATLTAGSGISIAESAGGITISGIASSIGWTEVTVTTQAMSSDQGYASNNIATVDFTLPLTATFGTLLKVVGKGAGGWAINQNAGQNIQVGSVSSTVGAAGSVSSTNQFDSISLVCTEADVTWTAMSTMGNLTIV